MDKFVLLSESNTLHLYKYSLDPTKSDVKRQDYDLNKPFAIYYIAVIKWYCTTLFYRNTIIMIFYTVSGWLSR